jgi:CheY-like chemotaxis protein
MGFLDDRKEERFAFSEPVIINDESFTDTVDISRTGLLIHTRTPLPAESEVVLRIPMYGVEVGAVVKHVQPGVGMGVQFRPRSSAEALQIEAIIERLTSSPEHLQYKLTVLVVEAAEKPRAALRKKLQTEGFSVTEAVDGMDAIRKMNAYPVHAMVMDLRVPKINALKLITMVRESPAHGHTPIVAYSLHEQEAFARKAEEVGANRYLPKAMASPSAIVEALKGVLYR